MNKRNILEITKKDIEKEVNKYVILVIRNPLEITKKDIEKQVLKFVEVINQ